MIDLLRPFVPIQFQLNSKSFLYYLRNLEQKLYVSNSVSIHVFFTHIYISEYLPDRTIEHKYSWSKIKQIITQHFEDNTPNQQLKFEL